MRQGYTEQEAMDKTGEIMTQCQKDWDDAVANLPSWGEETDKEVQRYLGACRDVARANLWWRYVQPLPKTKLRFLTFPPL